MADYGQAQIIRGGSREHRRVSYAEILGRQQFERPGFVPLRSDGSRPVPEPEPEIPDIPEEEIRQRRMEKLERETYLRVFAAAEKAGMEMGEQLMRQRMDAVLPRMESILRELEKLPGRVMVSAERFLVETLITLVQELLGHELSVNRQGLQARVRRLLKQVDEANRIVIRVAPEDVDLLAGLPEFATLRIERANNVPPGSVRLESDFGGVEDRLDLQLQTVSDGLRSYLRERLERLDEAGDPPAQAWTGGLDWEDLPPLEEERPPSAVAEAAQPLAGEASFPLEGDVAASAVDVPVSMETLLESEAALEDLEELGGDLSAADGPVEDEAMAEDWLTAPQEESVLQEESMFSDAPEAFAGEEIAEAMEQGAEAVEEMAAPVEGEAGLDDFMATLSGLDAELGDWAVEAADEGRWPPLEEEEPS
ncbi:MAG: hypothetical protein HQL56_04975 [Magnetococcales bacterium]|nr:hypothetical protein [Magnetococcales bacterium]